MESFLTFLCLGVAVGCFGTLIGAGGGFLLLPVLLVLYPNARSETLTSLSLAVVFANAFSGSVAYAAMRRINYRAGIVFAISTLPGAVLGAWITQFIPRRAFDAVMAAVLLIGAGWLAWRTRKKQSPRGGQPISPINPGDLQVNLRLGSAVSVVVGFFSSLLGIGGGIIHVPFMVYVLKIPVHFATATSHFVLAVMSLAGTLAHLWAGSLSLEPHRLGGLCLGAIAGAQGGAALSRHVSSRWIVTFLAVGLAIVGMRLILLSIGWPLP